MMLKLKLQYFGHLMRRVDSLEKTLMLGGIGGRRKGDDRGWDGWMASPTRRTWVWVNFGRWWWTGRPGMLRFMGSQSRTQLSNWTELNLNAEYILWNARLDESQAGIKTARRNISNLRYTDDTTLMAENKEELKILLMKVKEESEKAGFKTHHSKNWDHDIQSHHFMANRRGKSK